LKDGGEADSRDAPDLLDQGPGREQGNGECDNRGQECSAHVEGWDARKVGESDRAKQNGWEQNEIGQTFDAHPLFAADQISAREQVSGGDHEDDRGEGEEYHLHRKRVFIRSRRSPADLAPSAEEGKRSGAEAHETEPVEEALKDVGGGHLVDDFSALCPA
jgi:hypothetical protein